MYNQKEMVKPLKHYFTNNENLKSEIKKLSYSYDNYVFSFFSDNGVFSKEHIDYGSKLLLETYLKNKNITPANFLDVGCGYGFLGICLSKILGISGDLIDVNKRAVHLTKRNTELNSVNLNVFLSSCYENISGKYDLIITNPPIRAGKEILHSILIGAKEYLTPNGQCWFVMRKDHGAKSMIKTLDEYYETKIVEKSKGFYIISLKMR